MSQLWQKSQGNMKRTQNLRSDFIRGLLRYLLIRSHFRHKTVCIHGAKSALAKALWNSHENVNQEEEMEVTAKEKVKSHSTTLYHEA